MMVGCWEGTLMVRGPLKTIFSVLARARETYVKRHTRRDSAAMAEADEVF